MLDKTNEINLQGMAVGNGCWGSTVGLCSFGSDMDRVWQQFLYGHNAITPIAYKKIVKACGDPMDGPGTWSNCTGQGPSCRYVVALHYTHASRSSAYLLRAAYCVLRAAFSNGHRVCLVH